jgi:hypothetical protein
MLFGVFLFSCTKEAPKGVVIDAAAPDFSASSRVHALKLYSAVFIGDMDYIQSYIEDSNKYYNYLSEHKDIFLSSNLRILRNTIYAMHGYAFRSEDLQVFFQRFEWYNGTKENVDNELSENEMEFIQVILSMEAALEKEADQRLNFSSGQNLSPPRELQGIWLLESSYSHETGDVDRRDEGIILRFEHGDIFFNGKSINEGGRYDNVRFILEETGTDFLHGDYYAIVYSTDDPYRRTYRYYIPGPRETSMYVEYIEGNLHEGWEYYRKVFGFSDSITITDELNVRSSPSIDGTIIQTKRFGDILHLYDQQGSGNFLLEEGILDLWYKISPDREEWVNALYVKIFPFYIASEESLYRPDNGGNAMYTSSVIVDVKNAYEDKGVWLLNMDVFYHRGDTDESHGKYPRTVNIEESYIFNNKTVRLKENLFNNVVELYNDIQSKIYEIPIPPFVAWSWYHYDADGYDLSEIELIYGIETGKPIDYIMGILGPYDFQEYDNVFVYSQWGADIYSYHGFKIKFFIRGDNREVFRIIYEIPFTK